MMNYDVGTSFFCFTISFSIRFVIEIFSLFIIFTIHMPARYQSL